jgi:putative phosphoesterase
MTRIGILSDTHSYLDDKILEHLKGCDQIWHAGDVGDENVIVTLQKIAEVKAVYGNIDNHKIRLLLPENNLFKVEGMKVLITHIGGYPGKYLARVRKLILEHNPDIVVVGHSHILKVIYDKALHHLHINPGAAGKSGFHRLSTLIRFNLDGKTISNMEVVEMKR